MARGERGMRCGKPRPAGPLSPRAGGGVTTRPAERVVASPGPSFTEAAGRGAYLPAFKSQTVWI